MQKPKRTLAVPSPQRYHPLLAGLHWLLALLIIVALAMGSLKLQHLPNSSPEKLQALRGHMVAGMLILVMTLVRIGVRLKTRSPAQIETNDALWNRLASIAHIGLYLLVLLMALSGLALSVQANLPAAVFEGSMSLPTSFTDFAPRQAHGWFAKALLVLIIGHLFAALYHQFIRKDGLLGRMWFGRR